MVVGFALIGALALFTGSVLLIGYVAAAASLLTIVIVLVRKAIRRESTALVDSPVPRWADAEERQAA